MYKCILVAVDGSNTSNLALAEAVKLVKELKAQLRIVTVAEEIVFDGTADYVDIDEVRKAVVRYAEQALKKAKDAAHKAGVEAEARLVESKDFSKRVTDAIAQEAKDWPADPIVIGTHGRRGFNHPIMGSVAEARCASPPNRCR